MGDLVERLREYGAIDRTQLIVPHWLLTQAADEIARLREEVKRLREPTMQMLNAAVDATGAGAGMSWVNRSPQRLFQDAHRAMIAAADDGGR